MKMCNIGYSYSVQKLTTYVEMLTMILTITLMNEKMHVSWRFKLRFSYETRGSLESESFTRINLYQMITILHFILVLNEDQFLITVEI
jgi:hypothetical protein